MIKVLAYVLRVSLVLPLLGVSPAKRAFEYNFRENPSGIDIAKIVDCVESYNL